MSRINLYNLIESVDAKLLEYLALINKNNLCTPLVYNM